MRIRIMKGRLMIDYFGWRLRVRARVLIILVLLLSLGICSEGEGKQLVRDLLSSVGKRLRSVP